MEKGKQVAKTQPEDTLRGVLMKMKPEMEMALPKHLTADRLIRITMTAVRVNPRLLICTRESFLASIMTAASLGLEPDGILGQAYLIPFKDQCTFMIGYKGYLTLARNSGEIRSIEAHPVYSNDHFIRRLGSNSALEHIPADGERGEITHFYAIAKFKDGGEHWEVMTRDEVEAIRDNSQGYRSAKKYAKNGKIDSPWVNHFSEMGRKTVIRRLVKYLPISVDKMNNLHKAAIIDAEHEEGRPAYIDRYGDVKIMIPETPEPDEIRKVGTSKLDAFENEIEDTEEVEEVDEVEEENDEASIDDEFDPETGEIQEDDFPGTTPEMQAKIDACYQEGYDAFLAGKPAKLPKGYPEAFADDYIAGYKAAQKDEKGELL